MSVAVSKGEESDTASVVTYTYSTRSWVVALKRPSGSAVNRLLSRYLENESCTINAPVHNDISEQRVLLLILEDGCMERLKLKLQGRADGVTNLRA